MEKKCFKCGRTLPLLMFYHHPRMADGRLNKCKECTALDMRLHREVNGDRIREYDRVRGSVRHKTPFKSKFPEKRLAQSRLGHAIRDGAIVKPFFCVRCWDIGKIHGHHTDYSRPLDVIWLCPKCHADMHATRKYDCSRVASLREAA